MFVEDPHHILRKVGLATTSSEVSRVSIKVTTTIERGLANIHLEVSDEKGISATYSHVARRNYFPESLDDKGEGMHHFGSYYSMLTQPIIWNRSKELYPSMYAPISEFLNKALDFQPLTNDREPTDSIIGGPDGQLKKYHAEISSPIVDFPMEEVPKFYEECKGVDNDQEFKVSGDIYWKDSEIPPIVIPSKLLNGEQYDFKTVFCSGNVVVFSNFCDGVVNIWKYNVKLMSRSLVLDNWVQFEYPDDYDNFDGYRAAFPVISERGNLRVILALYNKTYGRYEVDGGYELYYKHREYKPVKAVAFDVVAKPKNVQEIDMKEGD